MLKVVNKHLNKEISRDYSYYSNSSNRSNKMVKIRVLEAINSYHDIKILNTLRRRQIKLKLR